jgi:hypothetical protein
MSGPLYCSYTNGNHVLKITGGSLDVPTDICPDGLFNPGDEGTLTASAAISPAMKITSS